MAGRMLGAPRYSLEYIEGYTPGDRRTRLLERARPGAIFRGRARAVLYPRRLLNDGCVQPANARTNARAADLHRPDVLPLGTGAS